MGDERTPDPGGQGGWGTPPPPAPGQSAGWGQPPAAGPPQQGTWPPPQQGPGTPPGGAPPGGWQQPGWQQGGWQPGWQPPGGPPRRSTNGVAVAALVCGLLALPLVVFLVGGFLGVVAVILGIVGLSRVRLSGSGRGMAITGIVAGGFAVLLTAGLIVVGVRLWQDPEFQEFIEQIEEEQQRQEELLDDAGQD